MVGKGSKRKIFNLSVIDYRLRLSLVVIFFVAAAGALVYRCVELGDFKNTAESSLLQRAQRIQVTLHPQKGLIVDNEGRLLAVNRQVSTFFVDPVFLMNEPNEAKLTANFMEFPEIEQALELPEHAIEDTIFNYPDSRYRPIKIELTKEQTGFVKSREIRGLGVVESGSKRNYLTSELFSHILGFAGSSKEFSEGLERVYYEELTGLSGYEAYLSDRSRRPINMYDDGEPPVHGISLILTTDAVIQLYTRDALHRRCEEFQAEGGIAIVINPNTGAILALANYPDFQPEDLSGSDIAARRNLAVTDVYEPGSIFKPIVAAIAIDSGVINKDTVIFCENGRYCGRGFGCIGEYNNKSYGNMTISAILQNSSNIGMAKIGQKMGAKLLHDSLAMFGFGDVVTRKKFTQWSPQREDDTIVPEFLGERKGILNPLRRWDGYSVTRVPYGQEIAVTAMQMVKAYSILANGGRDVQPHIVRAFVDSSGANIITTPSSQGSGYIIKKEVADFMIKEALTAVVNSEQGTGKRAALKDYTVFGKTGTANIATAGNYDSSNYVASFVGGAPAENPQVLVLVSIIKPNRSLGKGYTGGAVASPIVGEIIDKTLKYLKVPPETKPKG